MNMANQNQRVEDSFDPYHRWLGIPPKHQPPDHYRLLGIELFESDPEVVRDAAERQMAHVRRYALGKHAELSQRILNELAAAKSCLIDPAKKTQYDARLRSQLAADEPKPAAIPTQQPPSANNILAFLASTLHAAMTRCEPVKPSQNAEESHVGSQRQTMADSRRGRNGHGVAASDGLDRRSWPQPR